MEKMGFGSRWIRWIMWCISTASLSILLNGSPLKPIKIGKGLRQGDPLSPYLFILVSEALITLFSKAESLGHIEPVKIGVNQVGIKHLQFADDTLIMIPKNSEVVVNYFRILDVFSLMSGLKLNYSKSTFIAWRREDEHWADMLATTMGCKRAKCPTTYLGIPIGANMNRLKSWEPVLRKIKDRLQSWKAKFLSKAGKLTLIKSVLNSIPIYYMSMFRMPKGVAKKIIALQRNFFWGKGETKQIASVKWDTIELPKNQGGLGVGNILEKNLALMFKWWWRYSESNDAFWVKIVQSVHNVKGIKATSETLSNAKTGLWSQLKSEDPDTTKMRNLVENGLQVSLGRGNNTRFWSDNWISNTALKQSFPRLFKLSSQKDRFIVEMGEWSEEEWIWRIEWRRSLLDWEKGDEEELMELLEIHRPRKSGQDEVKWMLSVDRKFSVRNLLLKMQEDRIPVLQKEVVKFIWSNLVPPRAQITLWLATLEKLKTTDRLWQLGILDSNEVVCKLCKRHPETNEHVLFTCPFSWKIWMSILAWWGITGVLQNSCKSFILQWKGMNIFGKYRKMWLVCFYCVVWSSLLERNQRRFEKKETSEQILAHTIKIRSVSWAKEHTKRSYYGSHDFMMNLDAILRH